MAVNDIGGVWRTIGGRRVFIKDGQSLSDAMKNSGKFNLEKNKIMNKAKMNEKIIETQNKNEEYEQQRNKALKELDEQFNNGKITNEEYDKQFIKIDDEYRNKIDKIAYSAIYDEKNDNYMQIEKSDVFYNEKQDYLKNAKEQNIESLTDEEKNALYTYTTSYGYGSYNSINPYLNGENVYGDKSSIESNIKAIDSAMNKNKVGGEYHLYRGIESSQLNDKELSNTISKINKAVKKGSGKDLESLKTKLNSSIGKTIENKGYISTSTGLDRNYSQRGVTLVIRTNKNDKAIDMRKLSAYAGGRNKSYIAFSKGSVQTESEVLYNRKTNFRIKDTAITNDGVFLLVDTE